MDHYWLELPGPVCFSGADIYRRFVAEAGGQATAVELGAWKGRSAAFMGVEIANSGKPIRFYTVDHWRGSGPEFRHSADEDLRDGRLYEIFLRNIGPVRHLVDVICDDTAAAAARFPDGSVDFLYVDASHSYDGVLADLAAWFPKVKAGGTIAGDDWCYADRGGHGVRDAVRDFFGPAARIAVEPGSEPNPSWSQWSIRKTADLEIASAEQRRRARAKRKAARLLTGAPVRYEALRLAATAGALLRRVGGR